MVYKHKKNLPQRHREYGGYLIIRRSDFSREHEQFATEVAPTNTCNKSLCSLCLCGKYMLC
jgi:hypothetical protein